MKWTLTVLFVCLMLLCSVFVNVHCHKHKLMRSTVWRSWPSITLLSMCRCFQLSGCDLSQKVVRHCTQFLKVVWCSLDQPDLLCCPCAHTSSQFLFFFNLTVSFHMVDNFCNLDQGCYPGVIRSTTVWTRLCKSSQRNSVTWVYYQIPPGKRHINEISRSRFFHI